MRPGLDVLYVYSCGHYALNMQRNNNPNKRGRCPRCGQIIIARVKQCVWCGNYFELFDRNATAKTCSDKCHRKRRTKYTIEERLTPTMDDQLNAVFNQWDANGFRVDTKIKQNGPA